MQQRIDGKADEQQAGEPDQPQLVAAIEAAQQRRADQPDQHGIGGEETDEAAASSSGAVPTVRLPRSPARSAVKTDNVTG